MMPHSKRHETGAIVTQLIAENEFEGPHLDPRPRGQDRQWARRWSNLYSTHRCSRIAVFRSQGGVSCRWSMYRRLAHWRC